MQGDYPRFKTTYTHDELVEHFLLSPVERTLIDTCYGDTNCHGVAVLLKTVQYLGYFPDEPQQVPHTVRTFLAQQLQLLWDATAEYPWRSSTRDRHVALIRHYTGFRFPTAQDKDALETWLRTQSAPEAPKVDGKKEEIKTLLALRVSKASIAKITGVDRATLYHFLRSRRLT